LGAEEGKEEQPCGNTFDFEENPDLGALDIKLSQLSPLIGVAVSARQRLYIGCKETVPA
jgi:hypothetical protein